jgi:manganese transport protein
VPVTDVAAPLRQQAPPARALSRLRTSVAFAGPAFLVAVGYMDPGNWGTDLAGGSRFGYRLLWVLVVADAMALFLQYLSSKLGIATGEHLATLIARRRSTRSRIAYWLVVEGAMLATEMAEFLGVVVALRLLFDISLGVAIALGAAMVLGLIAVGGRQRRRLERLIFGMLAVIGVAYVLELWLAAPSGDVVGGLVPGGLSGGGLPLAVGIMGATVMPHNLFLHSGLILSRAERAPDKRRVLRHSTVETAVALNLALLVNAAILIMAAAAFHPAGKEIESLGQAHRTLTPLLGQAASGAFALALLASGLASSLTGTLAGQMVLDGFLGLRLPLVIRRTITMVPAIIVLALGVGEVVALVWSQVVLSLVLPLAAWSLVSLTGDRQLMGGLVNGRAGRIAGRVIVVALLVLNTALLVSIVS